MNREYIHKDTKTDEPLQQELQNYFQVINGTALYYENYVKQLQQELERYKNIVDEFINKFEDFIETMEYEKIYHSDLKELLNELKELKGSDN